MTQNERITEATMAELRKRIPEPDPARVGLISDRGGRNIECAKVAFIFLGLSAFAGLLWLWGRL